MVRDLRVDLGLVAALGTWDTRRSDPFKLSRRIVLGSRPYHEFMIDGYKSGRGPLSICKNMFAVCPRMAEIRRDTPIRVE